MAKLSIPMCEVLHRLLYGCDDVMIYRAWVDGDALVLDLRGPSIPNAEEIEAVPTTREETRTSTWTILTTKFVARSNG